MSQYLILIYEDEASYATATPEQWGQIGAAHTRFAEQIAELGATMLGGNALQPTMTATSIRTDVVTDGPFAETKEALGGYYLVEAKEVVAGFFVLEAPDLDVALAIAKLNPATRDGGVEVRPLFVPPAG